MTEKQYIGLMILCVIVFTIVPSTLIDVKIGYVGWFMVIYFIGGYIRLFPKKEFENTKVWGILTACLLAISWMSVIACVWVNNKGISISVYHFVNDCNKVLALVTAITTFLFFKDLHLGHNKIINNIASTTFGVLLIHANSNTMRQWLWKDMLNNVGAYGSNLIAVHACLSVLGVYIVCVMIDMLRIHLLEKPVMKWIGKILDNNKSTG